MTCAAQTRSCTKLAEVKYNHYFVSSAATLTPTFSLAVLYLTMPFCHHTAFVIANSIDYVPEGYIGFAYAGRGDI